MAFPPFKHRPTTSANYHTQHASPRSPPTCLSLARATFPTSRRREAAAQTAAAVGPRAVAAAGAPRRRAAAASSASGTGGARRRVCAHRQLFGGRGAGKSCRAVGRNAGGKVIASIARRHLPHA